MIDTHPHVVNFKVCPDKVVEVVSGVPSVEGILRSKPVKFIIDVFVKVKNKVFKVFFCLSKNPYPEFAKLDEMLLIFKKLLYKVGDVELNKEMKDAGIELSTPLMIDFEYATIEKAKPELAYGMQIEIMKRIAKNNYGRIMPFIGFDPRREDAVNFVKWCLFEKGFLGVKMYPKLGFHPSHRTLYNSLKTNNTLYDFYDMCQEHQIPITVHCSSGGVFSETLVGKCEERDTLVHPTAFEEVFEIFPDIYLNFAHSGGDSKWISYIVKYMQGYPNIFSDVAYNDKAHSSGFINYFVKLNQLLCSAVGDRIMFGSDWPMIRHTWTIKEFMSPFLKYVDEDNKDRFFYQNAIRFLFPNFEIPRRIRKILGFGIKDTPEWLASKFEEVKNLRKEE